MTKFSKKVPVWYQLAMMLRSEILSGSLTPGSRIDPEVRLAAKHGISVMPVRQALRTLETEGLLSRHRGRGTFVSQHRRTSSAATSLESLYSREFDKRAKILERGKITIPTAFQSAFHGHLELVFVRRLAFQEKRAWSYGMLYFLPAFDRQITTKRLAQFPLYRVMEERCGVHIRRSEFKARAAAATPTIAEQLNVDPFSPILSLSAVSYDDHDKAVGAFEMSFVSDPYVFSFETLHQD